MENNLGPVLFIGLAVVVAAVIIWASIREHRRTGIRLGALAGRLGLTFAPGNGWNRRPRINGHLRGKAVEFHIYVTGAGKSRRQWAALDVRPATTGGLTYSLSRRTVFTRLQAFFGKKEIATGDAGFDARWCVRSNQPEFFRAALLPELRAKLDEARAGGSKGAFTLDAGVVRYVEQGGFSEKRCQRYEQLLPLLCDLADVAEVAASAVVGGTG